MRKAPGPIRDIMGVHVVASRADAMIAALDDRLARGERIKLAFLNAHGSNLVVRDAGFRRALTGFTVLNDGVGVDIAARVLHGARFPENLNGTDFIPRYLAETQRPARLYLLGGRPGVAEQAAAVLGRLAPRHTVVGVRDGYFPAADGSSVAAAIADTKPDIVLVALGNPAQELFIDRHFDALGCDMAIGVGALFDFLAGRVARAPLVVRRLRLEWVYRLALEPGRLWRRYILGNFQFLCRLMWTRLTRAGAG